LIIPINADNHWTVAVIANINGGLCNEDYIDIKREDGDGNPLPLIAYFDSLYKISASKLTAFNKAAHLAAKLARNQWDGS